MRSIPDDALLLNRTADHPGSDLLDISFFLSDVLDDKTVSHDHD